jgi:hypothetical protein
MSRAARHPRYRKPEKLAQPLAVDAVRRRALSRTNFRKLLKNRLNFC